MDRFHVSATSHWPNYLPEYVAKHLGYYEDEGLDFSRSAPDDWTQVLRDLEDGTADLVLGGLWVPAMYHRRGREYVCVAALNSRNPKVLVMRESRPDFDWSQLEGEIVLAPGAGGTAPYVHTAGLMRKAGVDMSKVRWVRDLAGSTLTEMFLGGHGIAMVTDAINGALLERAGKAHVVAHHDTDGGLMPNSVYYTTRERLERDDTVARFLRAVDRAYAWLAEHSGAELKDLLAAEWPGIDTGHLVEIVDDLRGRGIWESIVIAPEGYDEWLRIQVEDGLVGEPIPYADLVDSAAALAAEASRTSVG